MPRRPHRVLLVDDVESLRHLYRLVLEREGRGAFEVVGEAGDGKEAVERAAALAPDLVLLDVSMPVMDGIEALPQLRRAAPGALIVMLSGFQGSRLASRALAAGATAYLEKGVNPPDLVAELTMILTGEPRAPLETGPVADRLLGTDAESQAGDEALRREVAKLREANRELEAFTYSVAHDLRGPLRGLEYLSGVLREEASDVLGESAREALTRMRAESVRLSRLIDDLLAFARVSRTEGRRERVDLSEIARSVLAELSRADPERRVDAHVENGLVAEGDPGLLRLVLENLLGNAWKFTSNSPVARIEVGQARAPGEGGAFFVRDNGAGFSQSDAGRLFQPFQRLHTQREFHGTGVGLASVKRIIDRHGGKVWAEGEVGVGATFYFTIPTGAATAAPAGDRAVRRERDAQ